MCLSQQTTFVRNIPIKSYRGPGRNRFHTPVSGAVGPGSGTFREGMCWSFLYYFLRNIQGTLVKKIHDSGKKGSELTILALIQWGIDAKKADK